MVPLPPVIVLSCLPSFPRIISRPCDDGCHGTFLGSPDPLGERRSPRSYRTHPHHAGLHHQRDDLSFPDYFSAEPVPGTQVRVTTTLGAFNMELFPSNAPVTVANLLAYANDGAYENTLIDTSAKNSTQKFFLQTGTYIATVPPALIPTWRRSPMKPAS